MSPVIPPLQNLLDFIKSYLENDDANEILKKAEEIENNSNQLLNYTNIIKENSIDLIFTFTCFDNSFLSASAVPPN